MPTIDVSDLTLRQIREIQNLLPPIAPPVPAYEAHGSLPASPYHVGDSVFIRTVTYHYTGRISAIYSGEIVLADAAWIADSGRFSVALATGTLSEVEPYPGSVILNRGAIVDVSPWTHPLPRVAK
jgi:hypothetical protein